LPIQINLFYLKRHGDIPEIRCFSSKKLTNKLISLLIIAFFNQLKRTGFLTKENTIFRRNHNFKFKKNFTTNILSYS